MAQLNSIPELKLDHETPNVWGRCPLLPALGNDHSDETVTPPVASLLTPPVTMPPPAHGPITHTIPAASVHVLIVRYGALFRWEPSLKSCDQLRSAPSPRCRPGPPATSGRSWWSGRPGPGPRDLAGMRIGRSSLSIHDARPGHSPSQWLPGPIDRRSVHL